MIARPSKVSLRLDAATVEIGRPEEIDETGHQSLEKHIRQLVPWRKGPFRLFGNLIDSEWRSDMKWNRIAPHLGELKNRRVLDVGCNNGYFMFRLIGAGAKEVLGIDPVACFQNQFQLLQHFARIPGIHLESLGIQDMHLFQSNFDLILHLGIIYHHPDPISQLRSLRCALKPGGKIIVETIGIPGDTPVSLTPYRRYANMRNVYFVPTLAATMSWMEKAKFRRIVPLFSVPASCREQRATGHCPPGYKSFVHTLDPRNYHLTREGYPAPLRLAVSAER